MLVALERQEKHYKDKFAKFAGSNLLSRKEKPVWKQPTLQKQSGNSQFIPQPRVMSQWDVKQYVVPPASICNKR